ncbi:ADP-ribosylglycohydrolase family protein [Bifidobacterium eulemuris]|uniref:ADP-ribosylglycohydrolase n=1 Tax=Bifidobacterium eulemuris TaxID=1765219 RepID=A0A261GAD6_9BIFI|nr:ADP-ribosylglycohydrolase family protein [Bifidobacterium eulemuris]OZG68145.1 ADP-ribosylglycohydrolase [Bifidobacterium eulemuris]QOL31791.1 ADP-ribosylglycohydrolase family protein [Bifidobacterium eulemuris]
MADNTRSCDLIDRARGALSGLAIGDALGMPTQSMSAQDIAQAYGGPVVDFLDSVDWQPIAPSMRAGSVTDDTEQAFLLAERLIADGGELDVLAYARDLLRWEEGMKAKGSFDLLGPSTKAALEALGRGVPPEETGRTGTTNGGAMRAAPVGIAFAPSTSLAEAARRSCIVTHNTVQGIDATTLVAAAVSYGMEGAGVRKALHTAVDFTSRQERVGCWSAKASVLERTRYVLDWAEHAGAGLDDEDFMETLRALNGTSVEANESVPAAFAITCRYADAPFAALCASVSIGGDTDTIAAMSGAILGACLGPDAFGESRRTLVERVNALPTDAVAAGLVSLRERGA